MTDHDPTRTEGETLDMPEGMGAFTKGQILGERYEILEMLGRGGMGEVWHAVDLKLRVEVALKALRPEFFKSERRLELLRDEVRAAREVMSPNVCRIFDLIEIEGRELVSMEYVDGATLLGVLQERGPLELKEAQDIASQFLAGLEAIHKVGLVHRDIKPENIMLTRAGRVVVMDFGLARQEAEGGGSVSGTPAYMAPEQAAGQTLDARADVYAAGVVLAEMVSPDGIKNIQSRQSVWEGVRSEPAKVPDTPWAPVIKKAVAKNREGRFNTARTLTRALEDVTLRVEGAEDLHPYPGLASFTEEDAEYFFGREAEVEQMWRKLEGPARMLAIMGPSGAGKTSFIRAGLSSNAPTDWAILRCTPGNTAFASLRSALTPELTHRPELLQSLMADPDNPDLIVEAVSGWRKEQSGAVIVVDQFEELFTLNSRAEQHHFASLLGRLPLENDVHVLLSMRDDFAASCNEHRSLQPVFHDLTVLNSPRGGNLRRALVQPATKCGYRFEEDELVEEMLEEIEGERGALPALAFAAARLWENRDRETGLLTRDAYHDIGGVGGALSRHAEAAIDRVGTERLPIAREIFRNLVTAEGTRAVREWDELLSVFDGEADAKQIVGAGFIPARESAEEVLRELIDARLLTSYEVREDEHEPTRRVEIIHESLLANWPRLVRWQTQDADAAQLRDQLRQAAKTWDEQGRTDDTLWTGSAYREFAVWRESYPGGLTEIEEAFAAAMTSLATRRRRRRRIAAAAALVFAVALASVFGVLWRRSVLEARRAEAAKLLALAQVELDTDPTEALAYATSSLELSDTEEARIFVVNALAAGPPLLALDLEQTSTGQFGVPTFSPDGQWLATPGLANDQALVWNEHGGNPIVLDGHAVSPNGPIQCGWTRDGLLVTGHESEGRARTWSIPDARLAREIDLGGNGRWRVGDTRLFARFEETDAASGETVYRLRSWEIPDGEPEELGMAKVGGWWGTSCFDPSGNQWIHAQGNSVYSRPLPIRGGEPASVIARHSSDFVLVLPWGRPGRPDGFYSTDGDGGVVIWTTPEGASAPGRSLRKLEAAKYLLHPETSGRWAVPFDMQRREGRVLLWDLEGLANARPVELRRSGVWYMSFVDFHPGGDWIVASTDNLSEVSFWPLTKAFPAVADGYDTFSRRPVKFTADGQYLVTFWGQDRLRLWPLPGSENLDVIDLTLPLSSGALTGLAIDTQSRQVLTTGYGDRVFVLSMDGHETRELDGFPANDLILGGSFSPSGRLVAAASAISEGQSTLQVWDLEMGEVRIFDLPEVPSDPEGNRWHISNLAFASETSLYTDGAAGLLRWDLETGTHEIVIEAPPEGTVNLRLSADQRMTLIQREGPSVTGSQPELHDLKTGKALQLEIPFTGSLNLLHIHPGRKIWVTGQEDGLIQVGRTDGGEVYLLAGHVGPVWSIAISPDGKWIASSGEDKTLRLWPMPDLSKPPIHTLAHDELIAKLYSLTNLRVVRDEESSTGWKVEVGPFPGWAEVPEW